MFKGTMHYRCATPGLEETPDHPSLFDAVNPPKAWANEHGDIADALFQIRRKLKGSGGGASLFGGNQSQFDTLEYCDPWQLSIFVHLSTTKPVASTLTTTKTTA